MEESGGNSWTPTTQRLHGDGFIPQFLISLCRGFVLLTILPVFFLLRESSLYLSSPVHYLIIMAKVTTTAHHNSYRCQCSQSIDQSWISCFKNKSKACLIMVTLSLFTLQNSDKYKLYGSPRQHVLSDQFMLKCVDVFAQTKRLFTTKKSYYNIKQYTEIFVSLLWLLLLHFNLIYYHTSITFHVFSQPQTSEYFTYLFMKKEHNVTIYSEKRKITFFFTFILQIKLEKIYGYTLTVFSDQIEEDENRHVTF